MNLSFKKLSLSQKIIEPISALIILCAVAVSIRMNLVGRSLWFDEAALAWSFSQRDVWHLTAEGLELVQAAPVGWLYLLKIATLIFGNTDFVLRVPSILFYVGTLILLYVIFRRILKVYYPMAGVAFAATMPILLQYSNVFKPYMSDCFFALLAVIFYHHFQKEAASDDTPEGRRSAIRLGILFGILVWFSNPACFVEGGLLGVGGLFALVRRQWERVRRQVMACIPLGISFVLYYFYWLRKIDDGMNGFWRDYKFPLLPISVSALKKTWQLTDLLFWQFYRWEYLVLILLAVGLIYFLYRKNELLLGIYASFALAYFASGIGFFPVNKRMWLFLYPLVVILVFALLNELLPAEKEAEDKLLSAVIPRLLFGCGLLGLVLVNGGIRYYMHTENVYWPGYEVKAEVAYLKTIIEPEDKVYVFSSQRPIFAYYNHYNLTELEDCGNEVLVGEHAIAEGYDCEADLSYIQEAGRCYIVMGDTWDEEASAGLLFDTLERSGTLTMVYDDHATPLFYYEGK